MVLIFLTKLKNFMPESEYHENIFLNYVIIKSTS